MSVANIVELGTHVAEELLASFDPTPEVVEEIILESPEGHEGFPASISDEDMEAILWVVRDELEKALAAWKELA